VRKHLPAKGLNMLAEATTAEISKDQKPESFEDNLKVAQSGHIRRCPLCFSGVFSLVFTQ